MYKDWRVLRPSGGKGWRSDSGRYIFLYGKKYYFIYFYYLMYQFFVISGVLYVFFRRITYS